MKSLYLDIFSGISGDMFVGAMIDLGVSISSLELAVQNLHLHNVSIIARREVKQGISGIKFDVLAGEKLADGASNEHSYKTHHHAHPHNDSTKHSHHQQDEHHHNSHTHFEEDHQPHAHHNFRSIKSLLEESHLSDWVKQHSINIFKRIAEAEGKIHNCPVEEVHFHEVGAVDSIVDIVCACVALEELGKPRVISANVVDGFGFIKCAHGQFPIPAPATLEILTARGIQITQTDEPGELVTPTGAALLAEFAESFGPMTGLSPEKIGYGLGSREGKTRPNVLRAILSRSATDSPKTYDWETDTVSVIEANLDDINPEILGAFIEKAFALGALDVFYTPIQMKKNRPAVLLTLLCPCSKSDDFSELILTETSSFGVRQYTVNRRKLHRTWITVKTQFGEVRIKQGLLNGKVIQCAPEYEDCQKLAREHNVPVKFVYESALKACTLR